MEMAKMIGRITSIITAIVIYVYLWYGTLKVIKCKSRVDDLYLLFMCLNIVVHGAAISTIIKWYLA